MKYEALKEHKRAVIFDTDFGPDCDDAGALAVLAYYIKKYDIDFLGAVNCTSNIYANGAIREIGKHCGLGCFAVGQYSGKGFLAKDFKYNKPICEKYKADTNAESAKEFYKKALGSVADKSVTIIAVGPLSSVAEAINSDTELFNQKVYSVVSMGCEFPAGKEFNIYCMPEAAATLLEKFHGEIIFCGYEIGSKVIIGFSDERQNNPLFDAYKLWTNKSAAPYLRESWDLCTVHFAFEGCGENYSLSEPVKVRFADDGANRLIPCDSSNCRFVKLNTSCEKVTDILNGIINSF